MTRRASAAGGRVAVEICVDDVEGALAAEREGADRIELCCALSEGGITPSLGLVRSVLARVCRIGVWIMIRPRGGHFIVSPAELDVMLADIAQLRAEPHAPEVCVGFVFGALTRGGAIDVPAMRRLRAACMGAPVTFHKAFDAAHDLSVALDVLVALGIERILTSGGEGSAEAGAARLAQLVERADGRTTILAAGGVRSHNVRALIERTGVREVHLRAMRDIPGRPPATCGEEIAAVLRAVRVAP